MRKKITYFWVGGIALIALFVCGFGWKTVSACLNFYRLKETVPLMIDQLSVREIQPNRYCIMVTGSFLLVGRSHSIEKPIGPIYPNPWAAEKGKERFATQQLVIWIDPMDPTLQSWEKTFPYKPFFSFVILFALLFYFLFIGWYHARKT